MTTGLPYPFSETDTPPYHQVALGSGEYIWVVLAGDFNVERKAVLLWAEIATQLYADLHPHQTRQECEAEVDRWYEYLEARS
jgi:hypothetical protein